MASAGLESFLVRGLVLRLTLDTTVLDDPDITSREKFLVVLNHLCPDDPIYFVMATSNIERFKKAPYLAREIVELEPSRYPFLNRPTALDLTSIKRIALADLVALWSRGMAEIKGPLQDDDLVRCDDVIRRSRFIEPRIIPLILQGIDLGIHESAGKLFGAVGWTALCQLVGEVFGVVVSEAHAGANASAWWVCERTNCHAQL